MIHWADRLPFFGPAYSYSVRPVATYTHPLSFNYENVRTRFRWVTPAGDYPFSWDNATNGNAGNGLRFPFQKEEAWTGLLVNFSMSSYSASMSGVAGASCRARLKLGFVDNEQLSVGTDLQGISNISPSSGNAGLFQAGEMFLNNQGGSAPHTAWPSRIVYIPAIGRGWWYLELFLRSLTADGLITRQLNLNRVDVIHCTIQECPPQGPEWDAILPPL